QLTNRLTIRVLFLLALVINHQRFFAFINHSHNKNKNTNSSVYPKVVQNQNTRRAIDVFK
ncbi:MAG: hypothetical protein ACRCXI_07000, partial [Weissella cibaria]